MQEQLKSKDEAPAENKKDQEKKADVKITTSETEIEDPETGMVGYTYTETVETEIPLS